MRFLVELYASAAEPPESLARAAASQAEVLVLRTVYVPEDELCLLLVDGASEAAVRAGLAAAGVRPDRVLRAIDA